MTSPHIDSPQSEAYNTPPAARGSARVFVEGKKRMKKVFLTLVLLALIGLLGRQVYLRISELQKPETKQRAYVPVAVEVQPVRQGPVRDVGLFTGSLYPRSQFIVAPKIGGRLEKLFVKIGDSVKRNQLIAVLEDDEHLQQVDQARAELEVARANLEESRSDLGIAKREFERAQALGKEKIVSESDLDVAEANFKAQRAKNKVALAQVTQKEAALKGAQVRLSYTQIRASWEDGNQTRVVGERFVDEGTMLAPNASIVSILDIHTLTGVIYVIERDYPKVRVGQKGVISTDAFRGKRFYGEVVRLAPLLKETSREARVEMDVPNPEGLLKPGMFIRVEMEFAKKENVTVVPNRALTKRNGQQGVFLADTQEMRAQFIPLTLGITDKEWAEVVDPPLSGHVVTLGQHLLEDGSTIILSNGNAGARPMAGSGEKKVKGSAKGVEP
jgi:RND family efflux transporter MFP subunit